MSAFPFFYFLCVDLLINYLDDEFLPSDTRPHYIRCIKPNDNAEPDEVNRVRVMEQLRYGGVLEAVRVARSGYPVRLPHKVCCCHRPQQRSEFTSVSASMKFLLLCFFFFLTFVLFFFFFMTLDGFPVFTWI